MLYFIHEHSINSAFIISLTYNKDVEVAVIQGALLYIINGLSIGIYSKLALPNWTLLS